MHQRTLPVTTRGRGFYDVTAEVGQVVRESGVATGLCTLFLRHTSASLVIQENADSAVLRDLARWMDRLAPESGDYEHDTGGPDDMPSHLRAALTRSSESTPVTRGV
ncbi:MAG: secondary thiamine-phosphate synthase enzyme YjbQ, partial [Polyangiaceae bacterium]|nr:secondary thiamine-phosphate synthase enzyme YjbQ [Polyangiaceae bacterium]